MSLNTSLVREQFPSLNRPAVFFDNPGGTQIARQSAARIQQYLLECNANHEGVFATSRQSDAILASAHAAMADFLNAARPEEIIFGANMTTLTLHISRSLARDTQPPRRDRRHPPRPRRQYLPLAAGRRGPPLQRHLG